jgi:hypothetical protein
LDGQAATGARAGAAARGNRLRDREELFYAFTDALGPFPRFALPNKAPMSFYSTFPDFSNLADLTIIAAAFTTLFRSNPLQRDI